MIEKNYFYYGAFENSFCLDWVTERLHKAMSMNLIPLLYAEYNPEYFAPPKSYINTDKFRTMKELSEYLQYLQENPREYIKYFWWKKYYKSTIVRKDFCIICDKLANPVESFKTKLYRDASRSVKYFNQTIKHMLIPKK